MKRLTLGLAVLLAGFTANSLASLPSPCKASVPIYRGGFNFGLTGLYWTGRSPQQNYATVFSGFDFLTGTAFGNPVEEQLHHRYEWGYKLNLGYMFPCSGNDVNVTYTNWDHKHNSSVTDGFTSLSPSEIALIGTTGPTIPFVAITPPPAGVITNQILPVAAFIDPAFGFIVAPVVSRASGKSEHNNHTWDLDFGQAINVGCNFHLRWFGGLRYTELENKLDTTFETSFSSASSLSLGAPVLLSLIPSTAFISTDGITLTEGTGAFAISVASFTVADLFHTDSKYNGIGPRFGFDINYDVGAGFGIVGNLSTSLLIGEARSFLAEQTTLSGTFGGAQVGGAFETSTGVVVTAPVGVPIATAYESSSLVTFHNPRETRVVPNIDAKLGLDWSFRFCNCSRTKMTIEAGYLASHYFDSIDRITISNTRHTIDTDFDGPYASVQIAI